MGSRVLIIGLGAIGMLLGQLLQLQGAAQIVAVDPVPHRRILAKNLGMQVVSQFDGINETFDIVVDAVGSAKILELATGVVSAGGKILVFGVAAPNDSAAIAPYCIYRKELTIVSANTNPFTMSRAVRMINAQLLTLNPILSDPIALEDVPDALERPLGIKTFLKF